MARSTLPRWRALLQQVGYPAVEHGELSPTGRTRALTVLTASHSLLHTMLVDGVPWPERVLATHMGDGTEVLNVHSPISPKSDLAKVRTHEAVRRHLVDCAPGYARILCGDLNTPRKELADGVVWTFARDRYGQLRPERGDRWDKLNSRDAVRLLHRDDELSWESPRGTR